MVWIRASTSESMSRTPRVQGRDGCVRCVLAVKTCSGDRVAQGAVAPHPPFVPAEPLALFTYLDYREYLRDFYEHKKLHEYGFSHRVFARRAGCKSANYPHLVLSGKRNLTPLMAERFGKACGLGDNERAYFCDLVSYCQAKSTAEKARCFQRMLRFRQFTRVHKLTSVQTRYYSEWYIPAIRELAARSDFRGDARWIARQLEPEITATEARGALKTLVELGLLIESPGGFERAQELVTAGTGPLGHQVVAYHRAMLTRASEAIDSVPRELREISSLTLCVSEAKLQELKARIMEFRAELLQTAEQGEEPERVVQLNFQLFPLSKAKA
jgi:uncharacterized protein (TIGR02147 family)